LFAVCCLLFVVCSFFAVGCWLLFSFCRLVLVLSCLLFVALFGVCLLFLARFLMFYGLLFVVRGPAKQLLIATAVKALSGLVVANKSCLAGPRTTNNRP
jgi:hypothetical protein